MENEIIVNLKVILVRWCKNPIVFTRYKPLTYSCMLKRYPAGFVYVYALLYWVTDSGADIRFAQYLFGLLYIITLICLFALYRKSEKVIVRVI